MRLTADLRMLRHSGIGRYLRNVFPLLLPLLSADRIRIVAEPSLIAAEPWRADPRIEVFASSAPIYSVAEQRLPVRGAYRESALSWIPHFNVPLWHPGKLLVTMHDVAPLAIPAILSNSIKRAYANLLIRRAARADHILCVSQFTQCELRQRLGVPFARTTVTPAGLDAGWPSSAVPHVESGGIPYLLFVGNVKPNKNLGLLLDAFEDVRGRLPHRLVLAGKMRGFGSDDEPVVRRAEAMGDRVRFAGEIDDAELQRLYAGASALVLPSLYEGFGLPLLEAMQLGCPVLCSTAGSLPEVGGDAARYFDPASRQQLAERLIELLDPAMTHNLREKGYERVQQFSFLRCAEQTAAVMNRMLVTSR